MEKINLNRIMPLVERPSRYMSSEWNTVYKKGKNEMRVCLCFPDLYEIGMSNLGIQILYSIINKRKDTLCERVYAPAVDMEKILFDQNIPLFSLESKRPLNEFDVLSFSVACELSYTNILNILNLGQIPLHANEREKGFPLVIAGGFAVCNPEPLADFVDLFVLGEGEEVIDEIIDEINKIGYSRNDDKKELLFRLSKIKGVYVPSFYDVEYNDNKTIKKIVPNMENVPSIINKRVVDFENTPCYSHPLVPFMDIVHNRLTLEIQRGCTRGCRFCQAGMISRPRREKSKNKLLELADVCLKNTGYEEVSLASLSSNDYTQIIDLVKDLTNKYEKEKIAISLPSLRGDKFLPILAKYLQKVKKSGLTFAPEAGSQRLRDAINKGIDEEDILSTLGYAQQYGWRLVKLYFMLGLPFEEEKDVEEINLLIKRIKNKYPSLNLNITLSFYVPKPHTPFQWVGQGKMEELKRKKLNLANKLSARVKTQNVEASFLEGVFSRGDRRLGKVIEAAYLKGCRLDQWTEHFNFAAWQEAFNEVGIDPEFYAYRARSFDEILPWDHLDFGVNKKFLWNEYQKAERQEKTKDCYMGACNNCGACNSLGKNIDQRCKLVENEKEVIIEPKDEIVPDFIVDKKTQKLRIKLKRGEEIRYISHLEFVTSLRRALRRANLPLIYSNGFSPQIKLSFGPALSVGYISDAEFMDLELEEGISLEEVKNRLFEQLPGGIELTAITRISLDQPSLDSLVDSAEYVIEIPNINFKLSDKIKEFLLKDEIWVEKKRKKGTKKIDLTKVVKKIECDGNNIVKLCLKCSNGQQLKPELVIKEICNLSENETKTLNIKRLKLLNDRGSDIH